MTGVRYLGREGLREPEAFTGNPQEEGGNVVQTGGVVQGANTLSRRARLNALLAILAIVAIAAAVVLLMWIVPLTTSGVGAENAVPAARAGSAVIHDDAGSVNTVAGSAIVHDDAGSVNR
ncbi:hypothetical protein BH18ACT11_BH18ACT11_21660 [soil metagenome]